MLYSKFKGDDEKPLGMRTMRIVELKAMMMTPMKQTVSQHDKRLVARTIIICTVMTMANKIFNVSRDDDIMCVAGQAGYC